MTRQVGYGLELGVRTLALVGLRWDGNRAVIERVERAGPLGDATRGSDEARSGAVFREQARAVLTEWRQRFDLARHPLVATLPLLRGTAFTLTVPAVEPAAVRNLLEVEIGVREGQSPGSTWQRAIATTRHEARSTFAQVALQRAGIVAGYLELLQSAGLRPDRLLPAPCALWRLLASDHRATRPTALLHVGRDGFDRLVVDPLGVHAACGSFGVHRLAHLLTLEGMPEPQARERAVDLAGGSRPREDAERTASSAYRAELIAIASGANAENRDLPSASRTFLVGAGARLPDLARELGEVRGHDVELLSTFRILEGDPIDVAQAALEPTALGAALACVLDAELPSFIETRRPAGPTPMLRLVAAILLLVACALWQIKTWREAHDVREEREAVEELAHAESQRSADVERAALWTERLNRARSALARDRDRLLACYAGFGLWSRLPAAVHAPHVAWRREDGRSRIDAQITFPWATGHIDRVLGLADRLVELTAAGARIAPWRRILIATLEHALLERMNAGFGDALASFRPPAVVIVEGAHFVPDPHGSHRITLDVAWAIETARDGEEGSR
ncbi:MAG: hypothetical protein H6834_15815 [Planctomycetes bacterium]|nr:hypothetical protein [Planctomycetota bacterium]